MAKLANAKSLIEWFDQYLTKITLPEFQYKMQIKKEIVKLYKFH
jgi:hypothetical protein